MAARRLEPGPIFADSRRRSGPHSRRDRDWQIVIVGVSLVAMLLFEMFHSPPCSLALSKCTGTEFTAKIAVNLIWGTVMGTWVGVALAAIMGMIVDALDAHRSGGTTAPLVRIIVATAAVIIVLVVVLVRFHFLA